MRRRLVPLLAFATAALGTMYALPAHATVDAFSTVMTGANERPGPGDPSAIGSAIVTIDSSTNSVCVRWHLRYSSTITAAHIHAAPAGVAGPVVVPFATPVGDASSSCTTASAALVQNILNTPSNYYVNVHSAAYPGGVMRGQLG